MINFKKIAFGALLVASASGAGMNRCPN